MLNFLKTSTCKDASRIQKSNTILIHALHVKHQNIKLTLFLRHIPHTLSLKSP